MTSEKKIGKVYLVGAGPGDPQMLTLRALDVLNSVDVIAYDALISPQILELIQSNITLISVGYRHGERTKQLQIEEKQPANGMHPEVIKLALEGKSVARLKQGDPMIFGRAAQEIDDLIKNSIPFEIVPGITSGLAFASTLGIPLTHRDFSSDVTFISGHDFHHNNLVTNGNCKSSWEAVAKANGSIVIYMGSNYIVENCKRLIDLGRAAETTAALIKNVSLPNEEIILDTLDGFASGKNLTDKDNADKDNKESNSNYPALIVVGDVVKLYPKYTWKKDESVKDESVKDESVRGLLKRPLSKKNEKGLLLVFTGNGKGKTSAALGTMIRKLAYLPYEKLEQNQNQNQTQKCAVIQFIKGKWITAEMLYFKNDPRVEWITMNSGFTWNKDEASLKEDRNKAQLLWQETKKILSNENYQLVILDELTHALNFNFLSLAEIITDIKNAAYSTDIIITGRDCPEDIKKMADLVSEIDSKKHPFDIGIKAKKGVDY
ncbi:MAG: uroporphyrinogen-III C-methyltransferase [Oligoflexia bacterium]|nr:uroporphyrinogen-III C-methyltransferase [Oligoflexia bacterium]